MPKPSPFSADDRVDNDANQSIGDLDDSYRAAKTGGNNNPVKHVPVRDATGSYTNEEPVRAYMMPSQYLVHKPGSQAAPKRPLGSGAAPQKSKPSPVPMYSQVATFGAMPRVRRERTTIPVEHIEERSWTEQVRHFMQVVAALVVAGALFTWDKIQALGHYIAQGMHRAWMSVPLVHARTTYSAYSGAFVKRMGMKDSRFKVITPLIALLFIAALAIFSSLVGDHFNAPGKGGGNGSSTQNGSAVLNVTPGKGGGNGNSGSSGGAQNGSNGNPQAAAQATQSPNAAGPAVQSSPSSPLGSGTSPVGGYGGGSGGTSAGSGSTTAPAPSTVTAPTSPSQTTSGSGTGSSSGGTTSGSTGSGSPSGSGLNVTVPVPAPVTVPTTTTTVPGTSVQDTTGKTIVGTSPITVTGN